MNVCLDRYLTTSSYTDEVLKLASRPMDPQAQDSTSNSLMSNLGVQLAMPPPSTGSVIPMAVVPTAVPLAIALESKDLDSKHHTPSAIPVATKNKQKLLHKDTGGVPPPGSLGKKGNIVGRTRSLSSVGESKSSEGQRPPVLTQSEEAPMLHRSVSLLGTEKADKAQKVKEQRALAKAGVDSGEAKNVDLDLFLDPMDEIGLSNAKGERQERKRKQDEAERRSKEMRAKAVAKAAWIRQSKFALPDVEKDVPPDRSVMHLYSHNSCS